jgi:hypothetical protein
MQRILLILSLATFGCEKTEPPAAGPEVVTEEAVAPADPKTPDVVPNEVPKTAGPLDSAEAFVAWKKDLQSAMDAKKWDAAKDVMKKLDPSFDAAFLENVESQKVESFEGQLDAGEPKEVVIQVRQHGEMQGTGEHEDFYWVGVLADVDGKRTLVGQHVRPLLLVCEFADRAAFTLGFSSKTPGPKAALWVVEQDVKSCGTMVEVDYKKVEYRVEAGKLTSKTLKGPASVEFDRMEDRDDE